MADDERVRVQISSINKAWRQSGDGEFWLLFRGKGGSLAEFDAAVGQANEDAEARAGEPTIHGWATSESGNGFAVHLKAAIDRDSVHHWVMSLSERLAQRGLSGRLGAAPKAPHRPWMYTPWPDNTVVEPTGFIAWTVDLPAMINDPYRTSFWHVPAAATKRITEMTAQWAYLPGAELELKHNIYRVVAHVADPAPLVARSVMQTGMAGISYIDEAAHHARVVDLAPGGETALQIVGGDEDWRLRINRLREALIALPGDINHGFIRPNYRGVVSVAQMDRFRPLAGIRESHYRYRKHLHDRYVPDAHGVQVLRTGHLERAHDLSAWDISDLGDGRYLVQAHDLEPWYAQRLADPEIVALARADFAGALLTEEIYDSDVPPWMGGTARNDR